MDEAQNRPRSAENTALEQLESDLLNRWSNVFVDATHRRLTVDVLEWMAEYELFGLPEAHVDLYLEQSIVASTFGLLCSASGVDYAAYSTAAKFTAIFLYLDDTTNIEVMAQEQWNVFHADLCRLLAGKPVGRPHAALAAWLSELHAAHDSTSCALRDFYSSFTDYCESLDDERKTDPSQLSEADFIRLRRRTIFVEPFIDHWRLSAGIEVPSDDPERSKLTAGQSMACDLIILANDLGSLSRDSTSETTEMNLILHYANQHGSLEAGVAQAVSEYNQLLVNLRSMVSDHGASPWFPAFVELLGRVIDGNLDTMLLLGRRYEKSAIWLGRLERASLTTR